MSDKAKEALTNWIMAGVMGVGTFLIYMLAKMDWSMLGWLNGFSLAGVVVILLFFLYVVVRLGMFDMLTYGVKDVFFHMNPNKDKVKQYKSYPDYLEKKKESRRKNPLCFLPYLVIAGSFLIAAGILRLVMYYNFGY